MIQHGKILNVEKYSTLGPTDFKRYVIDIDFGEHDVLRALFLAEIHTDEKEKTYRDASPVEWKLYWEGTFYRDNLVRLFAGYDEEADFINTICTFIESYPVINTRVYEFGTKASWGVPNMTGRVLLWDYLGEKWIHNYEAFMHDFNSKFSLCQIR